MDRLVGFGFKPSNEDIIDLLKEKRHDPDFSVHAIREIDFYKFEPWELPGLSAIQSKEDVWWFFHKPYAKAYRRTKTGYWKENGRGSNMKAKNGRDVIGKKRTLTFLSRSNDSKKAIIKWVMHEIAVKDDPLYYKENFVVCRLERKRDTRHGISTNGEDQSSRNLADDLINSPMTFQNESSREEPGQTNAPDFNSSKSDGYSREATQETISYSRNHIAEIASPKSQQLLSHNSISYYRNHVAESSSIELLSVPNDNWESLKLPNQLSVSYSTSFVDNSFEVEPRLHADFNPHGGYTGLTNAYFSALQSPIYPERESSYSNGSSYGCDLLNSQFCIEQVDDLINSSGAFQNESSLEEPGQTYASDFNSSKSDEYSREATGQTISYSRNSVTEIASPESQQLLYHNSISCPRNLVAENSSIELLSVPNDNLESLKPSNQHPVSYSTSFVDISFEAEPRLHAEFNPHGGYNGLSNAYFSALQSPIHPPEKELSYSNGSSYGCDLLNSQFCSGQVDDLINSSRAFQSESSLEEPGQTYASDFNSSKSDEYSREATGQTISYSRNNVTEIASLESQQLLHHNLISCYGNHVAENSSIELLSVPNDILESLKLPNQHSVSYSTNFVDNSFEVEPQLHAEFNPNGGYNGLSNAYFSALQSPIHPPEKELSYSNGSSYGCDLLNFQFCSGQIDDLINSSRAFQSESSLEEPGQTYASDFNSSKSDEYSREATGQTISYSRNNVTEIASLESQQLLHHNSISCYGNHVAENSSIGLLSVPNDILESLKLPNQHSVSYSTNFVDNSFEVEPQLLAEFNPNGGYNGLSNAYFSALQSPIHPEQVDELINSLRASQNESSREEPGQTFTPDFNSSKSDECSREATGKPFSPGFNSSQSDEEFMQNGSEMGH